MRVDFFYGIGSRYSYLAAARLAGLTSRTGASFRWRVLYSPDLIARAGGNPFEPDRRRGQYLPEYRSNDAGRWAAYLGIPYVEPDFKATDWRRLAHWCAAAEAGGDGSRFAMAVFLGTFGQGAAPTDADLPKVARSAGHSPQDLRARIRTGGAERVLGANLDAALAAGAFGVPSFLVEDGALYWGQDRLPLLEHHLAQLP